MLRQADTKCHFLDVPAEMRNRTYGYVAADNCRDDRTLEKKTRRRPALLALNKQIRKEFSSLYYSNEFFDISIFDPRIMQWTSISDRHLIEAIYEQTLSKFDRVARTRTLKQMRSSAGNVAWHTNTLSGVVDLGQVGGGRRMFYDLPFSVLGPCFERERVIPEESNYSDDDEELL